MIKSHSGPVKQWRRDRRGAMGTLMCFLIPLLLITAAMVVNVSYIELIRTETQIATDASCRAAGRVFAQTGNPVEAIQAAQEAASRNRVAGQPFTLTAGDFEFGEATRTTLNSRYTFNPEGVPNAVRITANSQAAGQVATLLPGVLSSNAITVPIRTAISTQVELDIALVIDRSGSMAYSANEPAVYPPNPAAAPSGWEFGDPVPPQARWLDTIDAVELFLELLQATPQEERVGLVTYNNVAVENVPITSQYGSIIEALDVYSQAFSAGGTNIGGGIVGGNNLLSSASEERPWATRVIIVMTDGIHNTGTGPVWAAEQAALNGNMVFTITFSDEAHIGTMNTVAIKGGGLHFHAQDAAQLQIAFQEIARRLPTLITR